MKDKLTYIFNRIIHHKYYPYVMLGLILWLILKRDILFVVIIITILITVIILWVGLLILVEKKYRRLQPCTFNNEHLNIIKVNDNIDVKFQCDVCERYLEEKEEFVEYGENKKIILCMDCDRKLKGKKIKSG